jgi:putative radical SAM enzyme (TIGR03279 family)
MSLRIKEIEPGSRAAELGILPSERLLSINGKRVRDFLDLQFYGADGEIQLEIERLNGSRAIFEIRDNWSKPLGIIAEEHECRSCVNNCIFCFIDQMPDTLRQSLYIKDDDVCFSFYYGNFITLTNLSEQDFRRITQQYLSPLYISVHTTNMELHRQMLRYKHRFNLLEKLEYLSEHNISFHTQIVVVPRYNDGRELEKTLKDLDGLGKNCLSIGIVPVGLTRYRSDLTELRTVTADEARNIIEAAAKYRRTWCSDEIYIKAQIAIPSDEYYEDYEQLENGIGMLRMLFNNWAEVKADFLADIKKIGKKLIFIGGELAAAYLEEIVTEINLKLPGKVKLQRVENTYFGETVTVTGLLTWQDIRQQVNLAEDEMAVFASNTFNSEGYTLDGMGQKQAAREMGGEIMVIDEQFSEWKIIR